MSKIAVVTDSTAQVPHTYTSQLPIFTIPLHIVWEGKSYRDNVDITPDQFYERLKTVKENPRTSQASIQEFVDFYKNLLDQGFEILSVHVSSRVSGTYQSAMQAIKDLGTPHITLVDSETSSAPLAFQVIEAAKAALAGATLKECQQVAERLRAFTHVYFVPGTLEYLRRGGRIGNAAAFLGAALKIHPILQTREGVIAAAERVRTFNNAMNRVIELVEKRVSHSARLKLVGLYADIPSLAENLLHQAVEKIGASRIHESWISTISPTLGVHIGPGAVGLAYSWED